MTGGFCGICYRALVAKDPNNVDWRSDLVFALYNVGRLLKAGGDLAGAVAAERECVDIVRRLAAEDPDNARWRNLFWSIGILLGITLMDQGDVLHGQGDLAGALSAYREGLALFKAAASQTEALQAERQQNLAVASYKIGNVLREQGKLDEALAAYEDNLAIRRVQAAKNANDTSWQFILSTSYWNIGTVLQELDKLDEALAAYRNSLAIDKALVEKDRGIDPWQDHLLSVDLKVADVLTAQNKLDEALAAYRDAAVIARTLVAKHGDQANNDKWQHDLAQSYGGIGIVLRAQGKLEEAVAAYRASLAIIQALTAKDPSNTAGQSLVLTFNLTIGDALADLGKLEEALAAYREANSIATALVAQDSDNHGWRHQLALSCNDIGNVLHDLGKLEEALAAYRDASAIAKMLVAKDASNAEWQHDLAVSYVGMGNVLAARDHPGEALAAYRESLAIVEALMARDAGNAQWQDEIRDRADKIGSLAYSFVMARNFATALEAADQAIGLTPDLIYVHGNRAHALMFLGRVEEARALYLKYRGRQKVVGEKSWEASVLDDFAEMRKAGLTHPLMSEIEKRFAARG
jgi:tetratricopeptide (TPR) repeat protein